MTNPNPNPSLRQIYNREDMLPFGQQAEQQDSGELWLDQALRTHDKEQVLDLKRAKLQTLYQRELLTQAEDKKKLQDLVTSHNTNTPPTTTALGQVSTNKEDVNLAKLFLEMISSERAARQAAETARSESEQARWNREAEYLQNLRDGLSAGNTKNDGGMTNFDIFDRYLEWVEKIKGQVTKEIPASSMNTGVDGAAAIQLTQLSQQHEERMEQIRHGNAITLEQMKQTHEIAMREADDRRMSLSIQLEQVRKEGINRQQTWADLVSAGGRAIGAFMGGDQGIQDSTVGTQRRRSHPLPIEEPPVGQTGEGLEIHKCINCGFPIPVPPEAEQMGGFVCPSCNQLYKLEVNDGQ